MRLFGYEFTAQKVKATSLLATPSKTPPTGSNLKVRYVGGQLRLYNPTTDKLVTEGYLTNTDLYSVINYIIRKSKRAKFFLYKVKDEKALADYQILTKEGATTASLIKAASIRTKALEETSHPQIDKLLKKPNADQSFSQFAEHAYAYWLLTGERMIHKMTGLYDTPALLYVIPPTLVDVVAGTEYMGIDEYIYTPTQQKLKPQEVQFSKMFHPALPMATDELRGLSPLRVLAMSIQKANEGMKSAIKNYQHGGPAGILSYFDPDSNTEITSEEIDDIEYDLYQKTGGSDNRGRIHVTNFKVDWKELGLSPVDLDVIKSLEFDLRSYCRAYGVDSKLFNDPASSTYNNMTEARKAAVVDAVVPCVEALSDDLNQIIEPFNVKGASYYIDADVTHFPELAEDLNAMNDRLQKTWQLTPNEVREALQYEKVKNPLFDEPWPESGRMPLSEFQASQDAQQPTNDNTY